MSIEEKVFDLITVDAAVEEIFGSGDDQRIFPVVASDGVDTPYCVYFMVTRGKKYSYAGNIDLERSQIQFSVYSPLFFNNNGLYGIRESADAITAALETIDDSDIQKVFQVSEQIFFEVENGKYHAAITALVCGKA